jgi:putative ABC transport system ATP-binding protein
LLHIDGLKKSYGSHLVVNVAAFSLGNSEQRALYGGSGSGKTTFLHLIAGILSPDAGTITLSGTSLGSLREGARDAFRARHVGYVFQTFNLLQSLTALENVELAASFAGGKPRAHAEQLLARVGLGDRFHYRPAQLSTGQQQRVAVARALINRPRLVLADEPTGNLDPAHRDEVVELLQEVCREVGSALLLVSHDPDVLARFPATADFLALNGRDP